jgi:hypothetical protein
MSNSETAIAKQGAFVVANGELKHYPAVHQNKGLKVVKLQWTNHFAVIDSSGFILPHSRTFDRGSAIAFCDICADQLLELQQEFPTLEQLNRKAIAS